VAVLACQWIFCDMDILLLFCSEKQGPAMRLEEGVGAAAALLRNHLTFWSSHPARAFFSTIQTNLSGTHQISVTEKSTSLIIDRNLAFSAGLTFCRIAGRKRFMRCRQLYIVHSRREFTESCKNPSLYPMQPSADALPPLDQAQRCSRFQQVIF
jgi:hypothetical protein